MLTLAPNKAEWIVQHAHWYVLGGVAAFALAVMLPPEMKCGAISGWVLFSLGVQAAAVRKWQTEPGLWMLSTFLGSVAAIIFVFMFHSEVERCFLAAQPKPVRLRAPGLMVDLAIATKIMFTQARFLFTITRVNWRVSSLQRSARKLGFSIRMPTDGKVSPRSASRVVADILREVIIWSLMAVVAVGFSCSVLGFDVGKGMMVGAICGLCTGVVAGIRGGVVGAGERRLCRIAMLVGSVLGGVVLILRVCLLRNADVLAVLASFVFGGFCGGVVGGMAGVVITSVWRACCTTLCPQAEAGGDEAADHDQLRDFGLPE
jgi:hypothetical protein